MDSKGKTEHSVNYDQLLEYVKELTKDAQVNILLLTFILGFHKNNSNY